MSNIYIKRSPDYLEHHGILGQKWGIRRYQNPDGSLTAEGRRRYGDILTPDQMKNMIKSYNIRTGSNKKINKHTVFKTKRGLYDYKGRKLDDNTDVDDPGLQNAKKSKADKKVAKEAARKAEMEANKKTPTNKDFRKMSDEELAATVQRMRNEAEFLRLDSQINPKKVSIGKEMANNLRDNLVRDIPAGLSGLVKNSIQNLAAQQDKDKDKGGGDKGNNNSDKSNNNSSNSSKSDQQNSTKSKESKPSGSVSSDKSNFSNLFGDKDSNLAYNMGKSVSEISNGIRNMKSDVKESYDKGRNYVQTNRSNMLEKALNDAGFSESRSSKAYSAIKAASVGAISQGKGSKYDTQDFWNNTVKSVSNSYYEAEGERLMRDWGLKGLDESDNWSDQFKPKKYN